MHDLYSDSIMGQDTLPDALQVNASTALVEEQLIEKPLWQRFIQWMRVHGNLDPDRLAQDIQKQMELAKTSGRITQKSSISTIAPDEVFLRVLIYLGIFDAAISNPHDKKNLQSLTSQIRKQFKDPWTNLCAEINQAAVDKLQSTVFALTRDVQFRRKPNAVIDTFKPRLLGTRSFDTVAGQGSTPRAVENENLGAPLYKNTVQSSSRAFVVAVQMRTELEALAQSAKIESAAAGAAGRSLVKQTAVAARPPHSAQAVSR
jgi:hypothetical protein